MTIPITDDMVREDLTSAHREVWAAIGRPGASWTGVQRVELAATVIDALDDPDPLPAWVPRSSVTSDASHPLHAPAAAHDIVYRVARHAGTLTRAWYESAVASVGELAYIELVALTSQVAAIRSFRRTMGLAPLPMPTALPGEPTGEFAQEIVPATLNWVPVAAPADRTASVVQAYTAVPSEHTRTWRLADAQYIPDVEMIDPRWTRGTLTRPQIELVATRVAQLRQCFF